MISMKGNNIMKKEEITLKNTKAEILEALQDALEREKNANMMKANPVKEERDKKVEKAVESSKKSVEQNIFSTELINKFKDLEIAIEAEEQKLQELYGIEKEMSQLTLVVNAGKDCIASIEAKKEQETAKLNEELQKLEEEFRQKKDLLQKEYEARTKELKLERERDQEEYNYKTKREREISNNKWEDEKKKRESELANMTTEAEQLLADAKSKEKYLKELETKVEEIPALLNKEYERGKKEVATEMEKENNYKTELLKRDFQNTIDRQNDKIQALQSDLEKEHNQNASLQEKIDKAYLEIKELATKTVETSGGVKIIGNSSTEAK